MSESGITIFGEVLFDCFPNGEQILGGAPFNICWHLQAFGDKPVFISRVGEDSLGAAIIKKAADWGIATENIQIDQSHPTGRVEVALIDNEPHYEITPDSAYDFICSEEVILEQPRGILYHGSLALRSDYAREQFDRMVSAGDWAIFLDVNLRAPWWTKEALFTWLERVRWAKLNIDELHQLGFAESDVRMAMQAFRKRFACEQVIVTLGEEGVAVLTPDGFYRQTPQALDQFVDTVGAGDAFTAVYIHGLLQNWPIEEVLFRAQSFAGRVIGLRGATCDDMHFYAGMAD
ncbi:carbohydrate kinase family protein [Thiomicrorhabdus heinhorstiae]|uniref:Carbohydrate kinase n=1 Tax=Thiomicrorhabdus heinhorstiae TaxID=2748010 RepID=A0ABS0BYT4_9GAMM|nr:PfkB family carbohydrate kinase [Thiomicrorhabdus heinhorstiae]MBF6058953.1 carbohydrate kinase [Thiomicrorhabdus heinhorstiae]